MAVNPVNLTETELFQSINNIGASFNQAFQGLKDYILEKESLNNAELKKAIEDGDKKIKEALDIDVASLEALKKILDGWDGTEDGALDLGKIRIEIQKSINEQGGRITVNEEAISKIYGLLEQEKKDRIALGESLTQAIQKVSDDGAKLIKSVQDSLTSLTQRVSAIEDTLNAVTNLVVKGTAKLEEVLVDVGNTAKELFKVPTA